MSEALYEELEILEDEIYNAIDKTKNEITQYLRDIQRKLSIIYAEIRSLKQERR